MSNRTALVALALYAVVGACFAGGGHDHPHPTEGKSHGHGHAPHKAPGPEPGEVAAGAYFFRVELHDDGLRVFARRKTGGPLPAKGLGGSVAWDGPDGTVVELPLEPTWDGPGVLYSLDASHDFKGVADGSRTVRFSLRGFDPKVPLTFSSPLRRPPPPAAGADDHGHDDHGHGHGADGHHH